jgi:hypothetical protein
MRDGLPVAPLDLAEKTSVAADSEDQPPRESIRGSYERWPPERGSSRPCGLPQGILTNGTETY